MIMRKLSYLFVLCVISSFMACAGSTSSNGSGVDSADYDTASFSFNTSSYYEDDSYESDASGYYEDESYSSSYSSTSNYYSSSSDDEEENLDFSNLARYINDAQEYLSRAYRETDMDDKERYARRAEDALDDAGDEADNLYRQTSNSALRSRLSSCRSCLDDAETYAHRAKNEEDYDEANNYLRRANSELNDAIDRLR